MKITGEANLTAPVAEVFAALHDPNVLVRAIPGCQRLEQVGLDEYKATVLAGVAAIKGTFDGDVRLTDQIEPHSFTLHANGAGVPGTVDAIARVSLAPADNGGTVLSYDADATIGGVIGGVGQRVISGVAHRTAASFFEEVDRALAAVPIAPTASAPVSAAPPPPAPLAPAAATALTSVPVSPAPMPSLPLSSVPLPVAPRPAAPQLAAALPPPAPVSPPAPVAPTPVAPAVFTPPPAPSRLQPSPRVLDLLYAGAFGAVVALLGVLIGALIG